MSLNTEFNKSNHWFHLCFLQSRPFKYIAFSEAPLLVNKGVCEMRLCLALCVISNEQRWVNRDVKLLRKGERRGSSNAEWVDMLPHSCSFFFPSDDSASQGEQWLCHSCKPCLVTLSTNQGEGGSSKYRKAAETDLTSLNPADELPSTWALLVQYGRVEYTKMWISFFFSRCSEKKVQKLLLLCTLQLLMV